MRVSLGLTIAIEPLNRQESNIINTGAEAVALAQRVDHPAVRVLADFYHLVEEQEPLAHLSRYQEWLAHIHLADSGRGAPGSGHYPYPAFAGQLAATGYRGLLSVECRWGDFAREAGPARQFLRQCFARPQAKLARTKMEQNGMSENYVTKPIPPEKPAVTWVQRPWGSFKQFAHNEAVTVSLMTVKAGQRLSLQAHTGRAELWIVLDEGAAVQVDDTVLYPKAGDEIWIPAQARHRLSSTGPTVRVLEVAFGNWQQADITRYDDDYARPAQGE
jgi:mannose-1-phosphate guanylyltransferase/mannose-6-phosphate isomerase